MKKTQTNNVERLKNIDFKNKLVFDEFIFTNDKKYAISKIWYRDENINNVKSLYVQLDECEIYDIQLSKNGKVKSVILKTNENIDNHIDILDYEAREHIKNTGIIKKYKLGKLDFNSSINEVYDNNCNKNGNIVNVLSLNINHGLKPTKFYINDNGRTESEYEDIHNLFTRGVKVKPIIEISSVVIDLTNNSINIRIPFRQILFKKTKPVQIELYEYSFIDSDDNNGDTNDDNDNIKNNNDDTNEYNTYSDYIKTEVDLIKDEENNTHENTHCIINTNNENVDDKTIYKNFINEQLKSVMNVILEDENNIDMIIQSNDNNNVNDNYYNNNVNDNDSNENKSNGSNNSNRSNNSNDVNDSDSTNDSNEMTNTDTDVDTDDDTDDDNNNDTDTDTDTNSDTNGDIDSNDETDSDSD